VAEGRLKLGEGAIYHSSSRRPLGSIAYVSDGGEEKALLLLIGMLSHSKVCEKLKLHLMTQNKGLQTLLGFCDKITQPYSCLGQMLVI